MKTLVITSCTGEKKYSPQNKLIQEDFIDKENLKNKEFQLKEFQVAAGEMYTGMQHLRLMEGIKLLRDKFDDNIIDLAIVSAGYGLLNENDEIVPYEVTFQNMKAKEITEWSSNLKIHEDVNNLIKDYDIVFFLLGDKYLRSIQLPLENAKEDQKLIFLASKTSRKQIPDYKPYYFIEVGQDDAKSFSYGLVGLKGYLFKLLSQEFVDNGKQLLEDIYLKPNSIIEILNKYRKDNAQYKQIAMTSLLDSSEIKKESKPKKSKKMKSKKFSIAEYIVPKENYAKNYGNFKMKYFIPDNDDRVDPNFNFINETSNPNIMAYDRDYYAHEFYNPPNYDGVLMSKVNVEVSNTKKERIKEVGVHKYIRLSNNLPIMGDCGAFTYIKEEVPPYTTDEILDYYNDLGFDIGVSIDHLIIGKGIVDNPEERERRYKITRDNAEDFIVKHKQKGYKFIPSGIAQGWDENSYKQAVVNLLDMGYNHISLGGLAMAKTEEIIRILEKIRPIIKEDTQVHLFGVQRLEATEVFNKLGVTSFDSSSMLRRAWTSDRKNYLAVDGQHYAAVRIPQSHGKIVKTLINNGEGTLEIFEKLENDTLEAMRKFDRDEINLEDALNIILKYTELTTKKKDREKKLKLYREEYERLLEDKPWKKCTCEICSKAGVETVIFRGNNRNRRRGFHNTYVFYEKFIEILNKIHKGTN